MKPLTLKTYLEVVTRMYIVGPGNEISDFSDLYAFVAIIKSFEGKHCDDLELGFWFPPSFSLPVVFFNFLKSLIYLFFNYKKSRKHIILLQKLLI